MKKILTFVFSLSMVLFSVSVFDSCKDYDENEYNDLLVKLNKDEASLRDLMNYNFHVLDSVDQVLKQAQKDCKDSCASKMLLLSQAIDGKADTATVSALVAEIAGLKTVDNSLSATIDSLESVLNELKDSMKDENGVMINIHTMDSTVNALAGQLGALSGDYYTKGQIDTLLQSLGNCGCPTNLDQVCKDAAEALARAKNDSIWIKSYINIDSIYHVATDGRLDSLSSITATLDSLINSAIANCHVADSLINVRLNLIGDSVFLMNSHLNILCDSVFTLDTKLTALESAYQAADSLLQDSIDALALMVKANTDSIASLSARIDSITDRLDKIDEALKSLITGIIVQQVKNPVFGAFTTPLGVNTNVLLAYYGSNSGSIIFPTTSTSNNVKNSQALTEADWNMIKDGLTQYKKKGNSTLISSADDNAGVLYVTVNPGSVDFAGQKLSLVNSKDVESGVKLGALVKENDTELTFGFTRAAEDNGFYSAKAKLSEGDIASVKVNIEDGLKSAFTDALKQRNVASVASLASKLYSQFSGVLPAQGLKASWTDYNGSHSTYSKYEVAATAIKPLSYAFMEEFHRDNVPGYGRVNTIINKITDRVDETIDSNWPDLNSIVNGHKLQIDRILKKIESVDPDKFKIKFSLRIKANKTDSRAYRTHEGQLEYLVVETKVPTDATASGGSVTLGYGWKEVLRIALNDADAVVDPKGEAYVEDGRNCNTVWDLTITKKIENVDEIYEQFNDVMEYAEVKLQDVIEDLNGLLDDLNAEFNKAQNSISDFTTDIRTKLHNYLDKINNKALKVINSANSKIQPVLLVKGNSISLGSGAKSNPTIVSNANITLIPTSYTAEIVTPAFKKHVAVTNVFNGSASAQGGNADCVAALKAVNGQSKVNEVVDGTTLTIPATLKPGYVYEFTYSALDYSGKISVHKYYVKY